MATYINDRFLENEQALLHVSDLSIQRGYAIFDFFRTVDGIPLFIEDHLDRFYASAEAMFLPVKQSRGELKAIIKLLIEKSKIPKAGIRIMLSGGYAAELNLGPAPNLVITCNPISVADTALFDRGFRIITKTHQRDLPHIKSINYQMAMWLQPLLKELNADDVLYCNNNSITELPRSNIFIVTADGKLITPEKNILMGITRKNIIALAKQMMPVEERDITVDELQQAAEIFLTSTTKRILPIVQVNQINIANQQPGNFTKLLYRQFLEMEKNEIKKMAV